MTDETRGADRGREGSLRARLSRTFGDVDPHISLDDRRDADDTATEDVLRRLATRQVLGERYVVHERVGRGGMGTVLRVWDEDLRRHLAMKMLQGDADPSLAERADESEMGSDSVDALLDDLRRHVVVSDVRPSSGRPPRADLAKIRRFLEEAQITAQLDHPGIVPVHEVGVDEEGRVFFTMKLVKGETLRTVIDRVRAGRSGWTSTRALGLLLRVCEAMAYAHSKGVIHRDLKPANVMVGSYGEVYVMDWGLAEVVDRDGGAAGTVSIDMGREVESDDGSDPTPERVVGTPVYMPPEQADGHGTLSRAADVYAIGAMIYHLLAGRPPYAEQGRSRARELLARVRAGPPTPLHRLAPDAPAELVAICEKAMAREVPDRYADTELLADDLRAFLEQRVVSAYETGAFAELRKWVVRNRLLAATLIAVIGLATLGGAGFGLLSRELARKNDALAGALERERELGDDLVERADELAAALGESDDLRRLAEQERTNVLRLLAPVEVDELVAEADELWPVAPALVPRYDDWLARAEALVATLDAAEGDDALIAGHRAQLERIRERARPRTPAELEADRRVHPEYDAWVRLRDGVAEAEEALSGRDEDDAGVAGLLEQLDVVRAERDALAVRIDARRTYGFDDPDDELWHDRLSALIERLEWLADPEVGPIDGVSPAHGLGVRRRRELAVDLAEQTLESDEARYRWARAIASIGDVDECPAYGGWAPDPQYGLLPLWRDPDSGLWEFAHLMSGIEARRDDGGALVMDEAFGLVLVLVPGGDDLLGAQTDDPDAPNHDPAAAWDESPVVARSLAPFFLSKYEMTQAQWTRMTGRNPAFFSSGGEALDRVRTPRHPVENVSWEDCTRVTSRLGLRLPSEDEWEYAARAGVDTPWWTGAERESLTGAANIADEAARRWGATYPAIDAWPGFDDGWGAHAPVDFGRANPFGLHGVHGNVCEWCATPYQGGRDVERRGGRIETTYVFRGGAFYRGADDARCANREESAPDHKGNAIGLRPARSVE